MAALEDSSEVPQVWRLGSEGSWTSHNGSSVNVLRDGTIFTARPGLLAHVLVGKYCDHLPLYRQSEIYAREGIDLDRSTLAGWVGGASRALEPLLDAIRRYVLTATKIHGDDIPVPVLAPGNGKTKIGRLWTYVRDDRPPSKGCQMISRMLGLTIGRVCKPNRRGFGATSLAGGCVSWIQPAL